MHSVSIIIMSDLIVIINHWRNVKACCFRRYNYRHNQYLYLMVLIVSCILCGSARCATLLHNVCQLNFKVMARNKLSIRFSIYGLDTAQDNTRDTIRYMPIRDRRNCLQAVVCFLCTELGTCDWFSYRNGTKI